MNKKIVTTSHSPLLVLLNSFFEHFFVHLVSGPICFHLNPGAV